MTHDLLIVEDEPDWLEALHGFYRRVLGQTWGILAATGTRQALDLLERYPFRLLSVDIVLGAHSPADGRQVLRVARSRGCKAAIVLTGLLQQDKIVLIEHGQRIATTLDVLLHSLFGGSALYLHKAPGGPEETLPHLAADLSRDRLERLAHLFGTIAFSGSAWKLELGDECVQLGREQGCHYLRELLSRPNQHVRCDKLLCSVPGMALPPGFHFYEEVVRDKETRRQVSEVETALLVAKAERDQTRVRELEKLRRALVADAIDEGRGRRLTTDGERIRQRVTRAIDRAIQRIRNSGGALMADYLDETIERRTQCVYRPIEPLRWIDESPGT